MKEHFDQFVDYVLDKGLFLEQAVELLEKTLIAETLKKTGGNQCAASKLLGIHRNTLKRKMEEFQLPGRLPVRRPMARAAGRDANRRHVS